MCLLQYSSLQSSCVFPDVFVINSDSIFSKNSISLLGLIRQWSVCIIRGRRCQRPRFLRPEFSIQVHVLWEEPSVVFLQVLVWEFGAVVVFNKCCFYCTGNQGGLDQGRCCCLEQNILLLVFLCFELHATTYSYYFFSLQDVYWAQYA